MTEEWTQRLTPYKQSDDPYGVSPRASNGILALTKAMDFCPTRFGAGKPKKVLLKCFVCRTGTLFGWFSAGEDNIFAPAHELQAKRDVNGCCMEENDTLISYLSYTSEGRLKQYAERGKVTTNYVWDVVHDRMLAKVQKAGAAYQLEANSAATNPYGSISLGGNSVFCYPETNSEVYTYNSFGKVASVTTGNGQTMYYEYDTMGRLCRVRDTNGKTVREYDFHYSASDNNN